MYKLFKYKKFFNLLRDTSSLYYFFSIYFQYRNFLKISYVNKSCNSSI